jgi:hypothetical protein
MCVRDVTVLWRKLQSALPVRRPSRSVYVIQQAVIHCKASPTSNGVAMCHSPSNDVQHGIGVLQLEFGDVSGTGISDVVS